MTELLGFGVKNLRCLTDTGIVPIKPLTLLVGRNSSGKSSFLRAFPLLRQSVENKRRSPIRWHQRNYVDFGSIRTAKNERTPEPGVTFKFRVRLSEPHQKERLCDLAMTLVPAGEREEYVSSYEVSVDEHHARIEFNADHGAHSFTVNGIDVLRGSSARLHSACLVAGIAEGGAPKPIAYQAYQDFVDVFPATGMTGLGMPHEFFYQNVDTALQAAYSIDTKNVRGRGYGGRYPWRPEMGTKDRILESIRAAGGVPKAVPPFAIDQLVACVVAANIDDILALVDWRVSEYMAGVAYLAPQRAMGERIYRLGADVPVDKLDPRGENLADFLAALSTDSMESLAEFTRKYLGFEPAVRVNGPVAEILIRESITSQFRSITDVGFGFAEVLPLCVSVWLNMNIYWETKHPTITLLALEQPELHLHPAHQARLATMLAGAMHESRKQGFEVPLLIETHSEALINGLGMLVRKKMLDPQDVQIIIFEQDKTTRQTSLRFAGYRETGALHDWPFGFLAPTADRIDEIAAEGTDS